MKLGLAIVKDAKALLEKLEELSAGQNITNVNACIACPHVEDQYVTFDSIHFQN